MRSHRSRHRDWLASATVRVLTTDSAGTGFLVAPGRVVTCAHNVPAVPGRTHVVVYEHTEYPAEVLVREPPQGAEALYSYPDVALLSVPFNDHPCVPISQAEATPEAGRELDAYGCPRLGEHPVWEHMTLISEGERIPAGTEHVFVKTKGGQVQPGASGAGVIDARTGELVGMLTQTRDPTLDLGGVLVPAPAILRTLTAKGHDVAAANRAATCGADTVAATRRRLRHVLQALVNDLAEMAPAHLRAMLMALEDDPPAQVDEHDAALALLHLDLDDLGKALCELAGACRAADRPHRLLDGAAPFAWITASRPWVEPQVAAQLAAERYRDRPRIVQVPVSHECSVRMHVTRASLKEYWEATLLTAPDAETDPATGLPAGLVRAVRCELLRAIWPVDESDQEAVERLWSRRGRRALEKARDKVLVLPAGLADTAMVDALRQEFAPCLFLVADRRLPPALREHPGLLALPETLPAADEADADERYQSFRYQIEQATTRGAR